MLRQKKRGNTYWIGHNRSTYIKIASEFHNIVSYRPQTNWCCPYCSARREGPIFPPGNLFVVFVLDTGKDKGKFVSVSATKTCGWVEVQLYSFLALELEKGARSDSDIDQFTPRKRRNSISRIGCWVSSTNGLDVSDKSKMSYPCRELNNSWVVQPISWSLHLPSYDTSVCSTRVFGGEKKKKIQRVMIPFEYISISVFSNIRIRRGVTLKHPHLSWTTIPRRCYVSTPQYVRPRQPKNTCAETASQAYRSFITWPVDPTLFTIQYHWISTLHCRYQSRYAFHALTQKILVFSDATLCRLANSSV